MDHRSSQSPQLHPTRRTAAGPPPWLPAPTDNLASRLVSALSGLPTTRSPSVPPWIQAATPDQQLPELPRCTTAGFSPTILPSKRGCPSPQKRRRRLPKNCCRLLLQISQIPPQIALAAGCPANPEDPLPRSVVAGLYSILWSRRSSRWGW